MIRDIASANMNDVTTTKQSVTNASGIVVLASIGFAVDYMAGTLRGTFGDIDAASPTAC